MPRCTRRIVHLRRIVISNSKETNRNIIEGRKQKPSLTEICVRNLTRTTVLKAGVRTRTTSVHKTLSTEYRKRRKYRSHAKSGPRSRDVSIAERPECVRDRNKNSVKHTVTQTPTGPDESRNPTRTSTFRSR